MHHNVLIDWFSTNKGQILQEQEIEFLIRSITVSCKQVILQIGDLGWNSQYIDCSLYQQFYILKTGSSPSIPPHPFLHGEAHVLPFKSESVDMIILPHLLDFHQNKHSILREVERILKPEGILLLTVPYGAKDVLPINKLYNKERTDKLFKKYNIRIGCVLITD